MPEAILQTENALPPSPGSSQIARIRLGIGLLQGGALYFLYRAAKDLTWPASDPLLFAPLLLVFIFIPVLLTVSYTHLTLPTNREV